MGTACQALTRTGADWSLGCSTSKPVPCWLVCLEKQQTVQLLGPRLTWRIKMGLQAPGVSLAQAWPLWPFEESISSCKCPRAHSIIQINI